MAQRFNLSKLDIEGDPVPIAQDIGINTANSLAAFAVSQTGVLIYRFGTIYTERVLRWVDREGKPMSDTAFTGLYTGAALSPDGTRVALRRSDERIAAAGDIWTLDLIRGTSSHLTFDPANDENPIWSPDGTKIVFDSPRNHIAHDLYIKDAAGAGTEQLLLKSDFDKRPSSWSSDGKYLLYEETEPKTNADIWVLSLSDKKAFPFLQTTFNEGRAQFSPDSHWVAYTSDESGRTETYVQTFPPSGAKWQISTSGGGVAKWRSDGKELLYVSAGTGTPSVWAVDVDISIPGSFKAGIPHKLFDRNFLASDMSPDGKRFLVLEGQDQNQRSVPPIRVVLNWASGLGK
jgi:Tol biopolymer transport system component